MNLLFDLACFLWKKWVKRKCPHFCWTCKYLQQCREIGYEDWGKY